jgi:hypothetical protein
VFAYATYPADAGGDGGSRQDVGRAAGCTYASGAGELGVIRAGPAVAADAVGPGGMACAANKVRQPPEARPYPACGAPMVVPDGGPRFCTLPRRDLTYGA